MPLKTARKKVERQVILRALEESGDNRKRAAELLDINRTTLYNKMHQYGIMEG